MEHREEVNIDNNGSLNGTIFRLAPRNVLDGHPNCNKFWETQFEWNKANGWKTRIGYFRENDDGSSTFMSCLKYSKHEYEEDNYSRYQYVDEKGQKRSHMKPKFKALIEFNAPTEATIWDSESKSNITVTTDRAWIAWSASQYDKIREVYDDPRTNIHDYITIDFDKKRSPIEMYKFKFAVQGEEYDTEELEAATAKFTRFELTKDEAAALQEVSGSETEVSTIIDYLMSHPTLQANVTAKPITIERANLIAANVLLEGVITLGKTVTV